MTDADERYFHFRLLTASSRSEATGKIIKIAQNLHDFMDFVSVGVKIYIANYIANVSASGNFSGFFEFLEEKLHSEHYLKLGFL